MTQTIIILFLAILLSACGSHTASSPQSTSASSDTNTKDTFAESEKNESNRLNQWFDEKYQEGLQFSPMTITFLGKKDRYDQIDSMTEAASRKRLAWQQKTVEDLKSNFNYSKLNATAKTSYDLWIYQYKSAKANVEFMHQSYIFHQMNGVHAYFPQFMINFHKVTEAGDMDAYIKRIDGVGRAISELLIRAKRYSDNGVRPPRFSYEKVITESAAIITGQPFDNSETDSPLWKDVNSKLEALLTENTITKAQAEALRKRAKVALNGQFLQSYKDLIYWLNKDLPNTDTIATGVGKRKGGQQYYNHQLKTYTTTDLTSEQIHALGLQEVERLTQEMEVVKNDVGFKGTLQEFFKFIKEDDQFFYSNTDEGRQGYITDTETFLSFINSRLPEYFGILPKADLVVKRVEAFREQDGAAQHYFPGTPDGSRPGTYYAHLSDMRSMPKNEMEAIAYHEANPGHHMQISIAQELDSVPEFRKQARFTAYSEGWALYAELLAKEMGAYQNEYNNFGRLITEIWRAVRLVVDTGLHAKGWTEAEAIAYFKEKSPIAEGAVISEVQRYIVLPGQATSYKIGMIKILELRAKAKAELGDKFDIREFHDTILGGGAIPMGMMEKTVERWILERKAM